MTWTPRLEGSHEPLQGLPSLIGKILAARGFSDVDALQTFLSPSLKDLKHPFSLKGVDTAVERLWQAFSKNERVCIYADFDLDGTSGLALLLEGLKLLGFDNLTFYQPSRLSEGYGVHKNAIDLLKEDGVEVLVTVDVGITAVEALKHAKDLGIDVILTDHHLPGEELPPAFTIINPNQKECESQLGHLCGAGVAYYLFLALKVEMTKRGVALGQVDSKEILDCFIIGTLTDMVPLKDENRVLTRHGLKQLEQTKRPGLQALMKALGLDGRPLTSADVAIRLAPKLNALSRMDKGLRPIDIFIEEDKNKAAQLVEEVLECNEERKDLQSLALEEALQQAETQKENKFIWIYSENFHKGVIGLVATRLAQEYNVPVFVGALVEGGKIAGSARAPDGFHLLDAFAAAEKELDRSGGHAQAAGFELSLDRAEDFAKSLFDFYKKIESGGPSTKFFDAEVRLDEINVGSMNWMEHLEPFGQSFEHPVLKISDLEVKSVKALRGGHLKLEVAHPDQHYRLTAMFFSPPQDLAQSIQPGIGLDALVEPQWNYFAGRRSLQLILQDIKLR